MIKIVKYNEIDFFKFEECINNSLQKNIYSKKEVLDQLCENWELLVYGDYDYVMPVPLKKKFGFKIVLMPLFCQQLGVFGKDQNNEIEHLFLDFLKKKYRILLYAFNHQNVFKHELKMKKNYFIDQQDYKSLRKNYFKGRKSTVKTAQYLLFKVEKRIDVLPFITDHFKGLHKKTDFNKFLDYIKFLDEVGKLIIFASYKNEDLTNLAIIINDENRYSLLGLVNNEDFKLDNGASFLIDRILQENIENKSFDFMGGNLRGIEVFFKSFGSKLKQYPLLEYSKKDLIKNFLKK